MRSDVRYAILVLLVCGVISILALSFSGALLYTLEQDIFPSRFHENTDVLKLKSLNSTTDLFPLMQELIDFSGPIVLNLHIRDFDEARRLLESFSKSNIRISNLVISLDMSESEMEEFSKSNERQMQILRELLNQTISLNELQSLEVRYRDENNPALLMSILYQGEAVRKKIRELYERYNLETDHIIELSKKFDLDTTQEEESVTVLRQMVEEIDKRAPGIENPLPRIPTLSLLIKPDTGIYLDSVEFFGVFSSGSPQIPRQPITLVVDTTTVSSTTSGEDGVYRTAFLIEHIPAGLHTVFAASGSTRSGVRMLNVTAVRSTTSLDLTPVFNQPDVRCTGSVIANRPVRNAPVELVSDSRNILRLISGADGRYGTQVRFSPGTHRIEARFFNDTFPVFSSKSPVYEVVAGPDRIISIRILDAEMHADTLLLTLNPEIAIYKDTISITGTLSGSDPNNKGVELFIDGVYHSTVTTGAQGSYAASFTIERIAAGPHAIFARYSEPGIGEIYSESRQFVVNPVDSITVLGIEMTDGGTALVCEGNVTAHTRGVSSAPVELVWDDRTSINTRTDATGSFRQNVILPVGKHRVFARFTSRDYPVNPSQSRVYDIEILPPIDLFVKPPTVRYMDTLAIGGSLRGTYASARDVQIFIDGKKLGSYRTDAGGNYSTQFPVEKIPGGTHRVNSRAGDSASDTESFTVIMVNSTTTLSARLMSDTMQVLCSGEVRAADSTPIRFAPVTLLWDGKNPITTTTDEEGKFQETLALPVGKHQITAQFNSPDTYPINPSESAPVDVEIPPRPVDVEIVHYLVLTIQPDQGRYRDLLAINGSLHAPVIADREVHIFIDDKRSGTYRTDHNGLFATTYGIEKSTGGQHTIQAISGDLKSAISQFLILVDNSTTTLSVQRTGTTSSVTCSGTVTANHRSVRAAPVTITVDGRKSLETDTDNNGAFKDSIILTAGTHRIQAHFNGTGIFPINPSESTPVEITILPGLSLEVTPASGIYKDLLTFEGTLISPENSGGAVDIFLDNTFLATTTTDRTGRYTYNMAIEQVPAGQHTVQARSNDLSSGAREFRVLPVHSRTSLTVSPVNNSALLECNGSVMAFDRAGDSIRKPETIPDVLDIIATFGRNPYDLAQRPVSFAPVALMVNNRTLLEMQTDAFGRFSEVIVVSAGDNEVTARFINDRFPLLPSTSKKTLVNIPAVNMSPVTDTKTAGTGIIAPVLVPAMILLFTGGAVLYLKRGSIFFKFRQVPAGPTIEPDTTASSGTMPGETAPKDASRASTSPPQFTPASTESILLHYMRVFNSQGLSPAARAVYVHFTGQIAQKLHITRYRTRTPREILGSSGKESFAGPFSGFIKIYEQIRYGARRSKEIKREFEDSIQKTDDALERGDN